MKVFVVAIKHEHGTDLRAATTREGAMSAIADYAYENWESEGTPGTTEDHADDESLVDAYFKHQENNNGESYDLEEVDLIGAPKVETAEQPAAVERPRRPRP